MIATRAWLACRASLHEGGYHYATSCGGEGADGAPTFLHTGFRLTAVSSWSTIARAIISACLSLVSGRRPRPSTLEGQKIPLPGARCQATLLRRTAEGSTQVAFLSDPLEPISAALRSSVLLERERAGGPPSVKTARDGDSLGAHRGRRPLHLHARRHRPFGPAAAGRETGDSVYGWQSSLDVGQPSHTRGHAITDLAAID